MTLVEVCEPIFQYICRINRLGRKGGRLDLGTTRAEVKAIFADMRGRAEKANLLVAYNDIELVLIFFVDSMILNTRAGMGWKPLSVELGELAFEQKFWDLLEEALRDTGEHAAQRLAVFYVCIGLGFTGLYTGQPDYVRRKMLEISGRLRGMIDGDQAQRICPDAYENVDARDLTLPQSRGVAMMVVALVAMVAVLLVAYVQTFRHAGRQLGGSLQQIAAVHQSDNEAQEAPAKDDADDDEE